MEDALRRVHHSLRASPGQFAHALRCEIEQKLTGFPSQDCVCEALILDLVCSVLATQSQHQDVLAQVHRDKDRAMKEMSMSRRRFQEIKTQVLSCVVDELIPARERKGGDGEGGFGMLGRAEGLRDNEGGYGGLDGGRAGRLREDGGRGREMNRAGGIDDGEEDIISGTKTNHGREDGMRAKRKIDYIESGAAMKPPRTKREGDAMNYELEIPPPTPDSLVKRLDKFEEDDYPLIKKLPPLAAAMAVLPRKRSEPSILTPEFTATAIANITRGKSSLDADRLLAELKKTREEHLTVRINEEQAALQIAAKVEEMQARILDVQRTSQEAALAKDEQIARLRRKVVDLKSIHQQELSRVRAQTSIILEQEMHHANKRFNEERDAWNSLREETEKIVNDARSSKEFIEHRARLEREQLIFESERAVQSAAEAAREMALEEAALSAEADVESRVAQRLQTLESDAALRMEREKRLWRTEMDNALDGVRTKARADREELEAHWSALIGKRKLDLENAEFERTAAHISEKRMEEKSRVLKSALEDSEREVASYLSMSSLKDDEIIKWRNEAIAHAENDAKIEKAHVAANDKWQLKVVTLQGDLLAQRLIWEEEARVRLAEQQNSWEVFVETVKDQQRVTWEEYVKQMQVTHRDEVENVKKELSVSSDALLVEKNNEIYDLEKAREVWEGQASALAEQVRVDLLEKPKELAGKLEKMERDFESSRTALSSMTEECNVLRGTLDEQCVAWEAYVEKVKLESVSAMDQLTNECEMLRGTLDEQRVGWEKYAGDLKNELFPAVLERNALKVEVVDLRVKLALPPVVIENPEAVKERDDLRAALESQRVAWEKHAGDLRNELSPAVLERDALKAEVEELRVKLAVPPEVTEDPEVLKERDDLRAALESQRVAWEKYVEDLKSELSPAVLERDALKIDLDALRVIIAAVPPVVAPESQKERDDLRVALEEQRVAWEKYVDDLKRDFKKASELSPAALERDMLKAELDDLREKISVHSAPLIDVVKERDDLRTALEILRAAAPVPSAENHPDLAKEQDELRAALEEQRAAWEKYVEGLKREFEATNELSPAALERDMLKAELDELHEKLNACAPPLNEKINPYAPSLNEFDVVRERDELRAALETLRAAAPPMITPVEQPDLISECNELRAALEDQRVAWGKYVQDMKQEYEKSADGSVVALERDALKLALEEQRVAWEQYVETIKAEYTQHEVLSLQILSQEHDGLIAKLEGSSRGAMQVDTSQLEAVTSAVKAAEEIAEETLRLTVDVLKADFDVTVRQLHDKVAALRLEHDSEMSRFSTLLDGAAGSRDTLRATASSSGAMESGVNGGFGRGDSVLMMEEKEMRQAISSVRRTLETISVTLREAERASRETTAEIHHFDETGGTNNRQTNLLMRAVMRERAVFAKGMLALQKFGRAESTTITVNPRHTPLQERRGHTTTAIAAMAASSNNDFMESNEAQELEALLLSEVEL